MECLKEALKGKDYILKKELELYTGGVVTQYTFANLIAKGNTNVPRSFVIGHKLAYRTDDVIENNAIIIEKE